jgi:hypothetical protein
MNQDALLSEEYYTLAQSTIEAIRTKLPEVETDILHLYYNNTTIALRQSREAAHVESQSLLQAGAKLVKRWRGIVLNEWEKAEREKIVSRSTDFWHMQRQLRDPSTTQTMTSQDYEDLLRLGIAREEDMAERFVQISDIRRKIDQQTYRRQSF